MAIQAPSERVRTLELEGTDDLSVDLGALCPRPPGQSITVTLRLTGLLPGRRTAVTLTLFDLEGETERPLAARTLEVDALPQGGQAALPPVRFVLSPRFDPYRQLAVRAECHYLGQRSACALP